MEQDKTNHRLIQPAQTHRPQANRPAGGAGRNHLPHAQRLSVKPSAQGISRRQLRAPHFSAVDTPGCVGSNMGGAGCRLPGIGRRRLAVAGSRCGDGQGAFWGDHVGPNPTDRAKNGVKRSLLVKADCG